MLLKIVGNKSKINFFCHAYTTFNSSPEAKKNIYIFHEWFATHEIYIFSLHLME